MKAGRFLERLRPVYRASFILLSFAPRTIAGIRPPMPIA